MTPRSIVIAICALVSIPLSAQNSRFELTGMVVRSESIESSELADEALLELDSAEGFGAGVAWFWSENVATELAAARISTPATLRFTTPPVDSFELGDVEITPVTLMLRYHFAPSGFIDPYIGAGAAYVMLDKFEGGAGLGEIGLDRITIEDEYGYAANAGISIRITPSIRLRLDGRYLAIETETRARFTGDPEETDPVDIEIEPLLISAGVSFRF